MADLLQVDFSQLKLGRKAIKRDTRTLRLAHYLNADKPKPPVMWDWTKGVTQWGMMLNDRIGDCTIAGAAHAVQVWTGALGAMHTVQDAEVLAAYEAWDGYNPHDPSTDRGGVELDVLRKWRKTSLAGHKLLAFADANVADLDMIRQAIYWFGGVYIGVALPRTAQRQDVWDVVSNHGDGAPGSWGGHCVYVPKYDFDGFTCITWGGLKRMTNKFWQLYCDEAHALLGADWIGQKGSPLGFNLEQMQADLADIH
jgi:hypothetical protein